jgi:U4/U6.U5 tri-snRNP component SNU23
MVEVVCIPLQTEHIRHLSDIPPTIDLARLGQTTQVRRSTLEQVRAHIAYLRSSTSEKVTSKNFDFEARLNAVKEQEEKIKQEKKESKKRKREEAKANALRGIIPAEPPATTEPKSKRPKGDSSMQPDPIAKGVEEADQMAAMMGFGGFGGQRKR